MRKLASIRKIDAIKPIPNADSIELAIVGGWKVVVKKGEFSPGDLGIYIEIDSWVPHELAPFLSKGEPKIYNGVPGERLCTVKLRGQISQGLLLPVSVLGAHGEEGDDVTKALGILKWEPPQKSMGGTMRETLGIPFPAEIPKTEQERVQNLTIEDIRKHGEIYNTTEKLDGASCTFYLDRDGGFHVCSRNMDLKRDENNLYWRVAIDLDIERTMREQFLHTLAVQGEIIGPSVQENRYKRDKLEFYAFDLYDASGLGHYKNPAYFNRCMRLWFPNILTVPEDQEIKIAKYVVIEDLLRMAEGESKIAKVPREGLVIRSIGDERFSFKVISNNYLLKKGE
jgi:RNA ligase (TIGR02306 family)